MRRGDPHRLKYGPNRERTITGITRGVEAGQARVRRATTSIPRVLGGLGIAILSTSHGSSPTGRRGKQGVGGEVLAYVW